MKLNALNVRTCNCNHFCKTSALSHFSLFSSQSSVNPGFSLLSSFSPSVGSLQGILQSLSLLRCILIWLLATQGCPWPPLVWLLSASAVPLLLLPDTSRVHQHSAAPEPSGNVHGASKFSLLEISRSPQACELVSLHEITPFLPFYTAHFSDGNTPRSAKAPSAGVVKSGMGSLSGQCSEAGGEEQASTR